MGSFVRAISISWWKLARCYPAFTSLPGCPVWSGTRRPAKEFPLAPVARDQGMILQRNLYRDFPAGFPHPAERIDRQMSSGLYSVPVSMGEGRMNEDLTFGIDLGIGSCGWAVLKESPAEGQPGTIVALGSWCFDVPETDKTREPTNQIRRSNRLLRRVLRRRRQRMAALRLLFHQQGWLATADADALAQPGVDPLELRVQGLDRLLTPLEFALALGHIAKRRGFKSNAKTKSASTRDDDGKVLAALSTNRAQLAEGKARTWGEMVLNSNEKRRNREGDYSRTAGREELKIEASKLFEAQRAQKNPRASAGLEKRYLDIAFFQRPLQDSEKLVGRCLFEPAEKRAAKLSPSFEEFRLLTGLLNQRIVTPGKSAERSLTIDELKRATPDLGMTATLSWKKLRERIGLQVGEDFAANVEKKKKEAKRRAKKNNKDEGESKDETSNAETPTSLATPGTYALRKALGEDLWRSMASNAEQLDQIAHCLSFFETNEKINDELKKLNLDQPVLDALGKALDAGNFKDFQGAASISAKAARKLLPHLREGKRYDEACALAGYDHSASAFSGRKQITNKTEFLNFLHDPNNGVGSSIANPIARKALTEGLKQLWAMRQKFGLPGAIHIELARDVGHSLKKRKEIEENIEEKTARNEHARAEVRGQLGLPSEARVPSGTLLRYQLWKEQNGECCYTGKKIPPGAIVETDTSVQVDHILPWSRFGDDSFKNKTLCFAQANQDKKNLTPYEWLQNAADPDRWETFAQRIKSNKNFGFKKRNFLLQDAAAVEGKFRTRNLNDTRYAARLLADAARCFYPQGQRQESAGRRRVFTRPGQLTSVLRKAWGVESLKKDSEGERLKDDRNHALDALVVAAVSEGQVQRLTRAIQRSEERGEARVLRGAKEPWMGFRKHVEEEYAKVFVARPERRRARGELHAATIRQVKEVGTDGKIKKVVFERRKIEDIKEDQLEKIKNPDRNQSIIEAIRTWINDGKPKNNLPKSPRGDVIKKVRIATTTTVAVPIRGGTADRGAMVRVDVFCRRDEKKARDRWFCVPIYAHQVMNKKEWPEPPLSAIAPKKPEEEWPRMDPRDFRFSLYPQSYVKVTAKQETAGSRDVEGYFRGADRAVALFRLAPSDGNVAKTGGEPPRVSIGTVLTFHKYAIDRLGSRNEIRSEPRTWHGEVCISQSPPD